jgi:hypothetical protein
MIRLFLLFSMFTVVSFLQVQAQNCTPAQNFPDTAIAIPPSWSPARLNGGIRDTACIGQFFEFTLSLKAPATIQGLPGVMVNSIAIPPQNGISNIPQGLTYICEPPNCVFVRDSIRCIRVFGTPINPADIGEKNLTLSLTINTTFGQLSNIPYPNDQLDPGGRYTLHVKPAGSSGCFVPNSTIEERAPIARLRSFPNPTSGVTQIQVEAENNGIFTFRITDLTGKIVHLERLQIFSGANTLNYDASALPSGMYIYSLNDGVSTVSEKLVISKR